MAILSPAGIVRCCAFFVGLFAAAAYGQQNAEEYQVKAAFLFNFAKFVEWPPQAFNSTSDPIVICVLGQNPFGHALDEAVAGKNIAGRAIVTREVAAGKQAVSCQILFISASERKRWRALLDGIKGCYILTVGESDGFTASGGVVGLKLEDGKVRFEINMDAAEQSKLRISSKLLSLAQVVRK
jgi:hypothetical protein